MKETVGEAIAKLWSIGKVLAGLGELQKQQEAGSHFSQDGAYGLGTLLMDLGNDLDATQTLLEEARPSRPASDVLNDEDRRRSAKPTSSRRRSMRPK